MSLFDHFVGAGETRWGTAKSIGGFDVDYQLVDADRTRVFC